MKNLTYGTQFDPSPEDLAPIDDGLHQHNLNYLGEELLYNYHRLAVLCRDDAGAVIGGIHGELVWEWLHIDTLWVSQEHRGKGIGRQLLARIEFAAVSKGFHASHTETTDFQALEFYLKQGYEIFGQLEGKPAGATWYYIKKKLV